MMEVTKICFFCQKKPEQSLIIEFSCEHTFCLQCFPYLLFHTLKANSGLNGFFLGNPSKEIVCPICTTGTTTIPYGILFKFLKIGTQTNAIPSEICDHCENIANNHCVECDKSYCQSCLGIIHQLPKNRNHKLTNGKRESKILQEFGPAKCVCPAKEYLSDFCFQCKTAICLCSLSQKNT